MGMEHNLAYKMHGRGIEALFLVRSGDRINWTGGAAECAS